MARRKNVTTEAEPTGVSVENPDGTKVILWKATRPLTTQEHEQLSEKLRHEETQTGLTIMLVPFAINPTTE